MGKLNVNLSSYLNYVVLLNSLQEKYSTLNIRAKVISALSITFFLLFLSQFFIARGIFLNGFLKIEEDDIKLHSEQIRTAINNEMNAIDATVGDWAQWDDTYEFAANLNQDYINENLYPSSYSSLGINTFFLFNNSQKIIHLAVFDLEKKQLITPSPEFQKLAKIRLKYPTQKRIKGIVMINQKPLLFAAHSVLPNEADQNTISRGTLIMGRFLNEAKLQEISETVKFSLQIYNYNNLDLPKSVQLAKSHFSPDKLITTQSLNKQKMASYILFKDFFDQPAFIIRTEIDRHLYAKAKETLFYYFWTTLLIGLATCEICLRLLEKLVFSRLDYLNTAVNQIGETGKLITSIALSGQDELSNLSHTLNNTLEQLQQAQEALQKSEERYALAVEGANDGLWDWNLITDIIYFSPRWKQILGYQEYELSNHPTEWLQRIHSQDQKSFENAMINHLEGKTEYLNHEHHIQHQEGYYCWVLCRGIAIRDDYGQAYRLAGSLSDITTRKQAEEILAKQAEILARSNAELEQFAYVASHDLQEPLRKIESFGDRLKSKLGHELSPQGLDYLERMQKASSRMRTLIQDLLTYSRVTTQSQAFILINLNELILDVLSDLEIRIQETNGQVTFNELPTIEADPTQMRQLFQNLIGNALKFHKPEKRPRIKLNARRLEPEINAYSTLGDLNQSNPLYEITVKDNGIGFDEKYTERIFQVFQRLHGRSKYEGTGIGLAVCYKIVKRHGGTLSAKSTPNQGSTFIVTLPSKQLKHSSTQNTVIGNDNPPSTDRI